MLAGPFAITPLTTVSVVASAELTAHTAATAAMPQPAANRESLLLREFVILE